MKLWFAGLRFFLPLVFWSLWSFDAYSQIPLNRHTSLAVHLDSGDEGWSDAFGGMAGIDGAIENAVAFQGSLYVTGYLNSVNETRSPCAARLSEEGWLPVGSADTGHCTALATDGDGLYATRQVVLDGTYAVQVMSWENDDWIPISPGIGGNPKSLIVADDVPYLAVSYDSNNVTIGAVYRLQNGGWTRLGASFKHEVKALAFFKNELYAGSSIGDLSYDSIFFRWDGITWQSLDRSFGWADIRSFQVRDNYLYIGGSFKGIGTGANRIEAEHLVRFDGTTFEPIGSEHIEINKMVLQDDAIFVAGNGYWVGDQFVVNMGAYRDGKWDWFEELQGNPVALVAGGGAVYAAGGDVKWTSSDRAVKGVLRYEEAGWAELAGGENHGMDDRVRALAYFEGNVIVGGLFTRVAGQDIQGLARYHHDGVWSDFPGIRGRVSALAVSGDTLFAAGTLYPDGSPKAYLTARYTGGTWTFLGEEVLDGQITSLRPYRDAVFASGYITYTPSRARTDVVRIGAISIVSINSKLDDTSAELAVVQGRLVAGGSFSLGGGLVEWTGQDWVPFLGGLKSNGSYQSSVHSLYSTGDTLYVNGYFDYIGDEKVRFHAFWNGSGWEPFPGILYDNLRALVVRGPYLFGLLMSPDYNTGRFKITYWNGREWKYLGSGANKPIYSLLVTETDLYTGGEFTTMGGKSSNRFGHWHGTLIPTDIESLPRDVPIDVTVWPNPASGPVRIRFGLDRPECVHLVVYDVLGRKIGSVVDRLTMTRGEHTLTWDPAGLPSGPYLVRLQTDQDVRSRVVTVVR